MTDQDLQSVQRPVASETECERLKKENAELRERIKRLEPLASPVGWGNEAEDRAVQED